MVGGARIGMLLLALAAMPVSGPAWAQDRPVPDPFAGMEVGALVGRRVLTWGGEDVGSVVGVIRAGGDVIAVVGLGGVLGLGRRDVLVPLGGLVPVEGGVILRRRAGEALDEMPDYSGDGVDLPADAILPGPPAADVPAVDLPGADVPAADEPADLPVEK